MDVSNCKVSCLRQFNLKINWEENIPFSFNFIAQLIICQSLFGAVTSEFLCFYFFFSTNRFSKLIYLFSSSYSFLALRVSEWHKQQIEHLDDGLNLIHLRNVDHNLSGEVKCCAVSRSDPKVFNVYHTTLTVLPLPISERHKSIETLVVENCDKNSFVHDLTAYITKRPDDITVLVGESIQLDVEYVGVPEPTVNWMRAVSLPKMNIQLVLTSTNAQFHLVYDMLMHVCFRLLCQNRMFFFNVELERHEHKKITLKTSFFCCSRVCFSRYHFTLFKRKKSIQLNFNSSRS